ncbi:MAG: sigma 54-interacting transcriptional regulator [Myxococcales bacterium]|nr:sigma 54-interacting transcriptional regulator [Myxococcales bacterium]
MASETETLRPVPLSGQVDLAITTPRRLFRRALPEGERVVVGRDEGAAVTLDDPSVSRAHAAFVRTKHGLWIEDTGSHNGTWVHGRRLHAGERAPVVAGAVIQIGACALTARPRGESHAPELAVVAEDPRTIQVLDLVARAAPSALPVLLLGETGTGKEVLARAVHELSPRASRELVAVNCAAIPDTMVEAELFGYERGAFTGASAAKPGLFERADGGTLFLDEIGELPLPAQAKLLRALETGEVQRLGALKPTKVDVRVVTATHRDLAAWARDGRFRSDLLFRLNGVSVSIPALRDRRADVLPLARHFLALAAARQGAAAPSLDASAEERLLVHPFPGNVRELKMAMERAIALARSPDVLTGGDLLLDEAEPRPRAEPTGNAEHDALLDALARAHGNQTEAAKILGVSRRTVVNRIEKYGVGRPRKGGA